MKPHTARQLLKKKADMIKYTKDRVKMSAYLDEWEKISKRKRAKLKPDYARRAALGASFGGAAGAGGAALAALGGLLLRNPLALREVLKGAGQAGLAGAAAGVPLSMAFTNISKVSEWEKISKKKKQKSSGTWDKVKAYSPLAGVGALIGLGKGTAEKAIETRAEKHLPKRYRSLSRGIGKGATGAVSTLIIGLTMADLLQKAKKKAKGG